MKKTLALLASLLLSSAAVADEVSVIGHGFSKHLDEHSFNERNYGLGLRYEKDSMALQVGTYDNSVHRHGNYVVVDWSPLQTSLGGCFTAGAGVFAGAATGYLYPVIPVVGMQASVRCDRFFVRLRAAPDPYYNSKAVGAVEAGITIFKF